VDEIQSHGEVTTTSPREAGTDLEFAVNLAEHHPAMIWRASMPKYVIEREVPGAGSLTPEQLKSISQTSCSVLSKLGCEIQWIQSFVTGDKIYCIYRASNEELIKEHAQLGGFPANIISEVSTTIDPSTAEG
jgi:hypothetical protein